MTSSPSSISERIVKKIMGLPPGTTTTSSLGTFTPPVRLTYSDLKAGIGVNDFISLINKRKDREENNGLAAGDDHDFVAGHLHPTGAANIFSESLTEIR